MNRRTLLAAAGALSAASLAPRSLLAHGGTPEAEHFQQLEIIVKDDGYTLPETIPAGRTLVTVTNQGTTGSHTSLGVLPADVTRETVKADLDDSSSDASSEDPGAPDWFWSTSWFGLPDWPKPGESVTGVVDLKPGVAVMLNPIGGQKPLLVEITGEFSAAAEPAADATVQLVEMAIKLPENGFKTGKQRIKIENHGAVEHDFIVMPLPDGVTKEQLLALFAQPEDATPVPGQPNIEFAPLAACSMLSEGGTTWTDMDLPAGHYAGLCMLPDQTTGMPHAFMGMIETFDVK